MHGTLVFNPDLDFDYFAFGRTDSELMDNAQDIVTAQKAASPTYTWTVTFDAVIDYYMKLSRDNLMTMVMTDTATSAYFYNNFIPWSGNPTPAFEDLAQANKSPRSSFPTTLGTDGQRLKQNKSSSDGAAANYIAKLYFLTSDIRFKQLFDSLKAKKITAKEALAAANILRDSLR
jgi:hypothetical protein